MNNIEFVNMLASFAKLVHSNEGAWNKFIYDFEFSSEEKEQFEDKVFQISENNFEMKDFLDDFKGDTKDMDDKIMDLKLAKDDLSLDTIKDLENTTENVIEEWNEYLGLKLKNIFKKENNA